MDKIGTAEVLRLRATSAVSRDQSVRRFAQDDDSVGVLTKNTLNKLALMGRIPGPADPPGESSSHPGSKARLWQDKRSCRLKPSAPDLGPGLTQIKKIRCLGSPHALSFGWPTWPLANCCRSSPANPDRAGFAQARHPGRGMLFLPPRTVPILGRRRCCSGNSPPPSSSQNH
jgi:hypothetical protein